MASQKTTVPNRRAFMKRVGMAAAYATPLVAAMGSTAAATRHSPFQKVKSLLSESRGLVVQARRSARELGAEDRRKLLFEFESFETEVRGLSRDLRR